jgi:RNA polymerase sigma-70 factor (ECF subfamily)
MKESIDRLYREYGHMVLRRARRILRDEQEALEVLQEVFVSLMEKPEQFGGKSRMTTWLYSVTTHACLNRLRNQRTRSRLLREHVAPVVAGKTAPSPDAEAVLLGRLLATLPEDVAQAGVYYYVDEMTHAQIAVILDCSRRHVGDLLQRFHAQAGALAGVA